MAILKNMSIFSKITNYLKEVRIELKKVNMPTRQETTKYTLIVIGLSFVVAVFLGGFDFLFTWIVSNFLL
ncbi:preprotein translocase subunit SecE [Patescibacteria group bacterium]|nr:preprotein translocase subunit SecE [Patescibacteria group bacterium]MBU4458524.1 preprotein translocase subunit SecE [Patescibacteria group bacterium]